MYLPAFRKVRRISGQDKRGAFMGATYAILILDKLRVKDYHSTLEGEEKVNGRDSWKIERIPVSQDVINKNGYNRTLLWVDKERDIVLKQITSIVRMLNINHWRLPRYIDSGYLDHYAQQNA
jgi:hypothetical protein